MSAVYRHDCGQTMIGAIGRNGFDYCITFWHLVTDRPITRCPNCDAGLADALRRGELIDLQLMRSNIQRTHHPKEGQHDEN